MRLMELKCPNCGVSIQVDEERDFCFCSYCGTKCAIDNGTIHIIDEAKIREAEAMEKVRLAENQTRLEVEKQKEDNKQMIMLVAILFLALTVMMALVLLLD